MNEHFLAATTRIETITPERARVLLAGMGENRNLRDGHARELAAALRKGMWRLNGETIKISRKNKIIDGQHRLQAIIIAETPMTSFIVYGLDEDTFDTIDTGMKRTSGDILQMAGCTNAVAVGGAIRLYDAIVLNKTDGSQRLSPDEARLRWIADPTIEQSVASACIARRVIAPAIAGALHMLFSQKDRAAADKFFEDIAKGADLAALDPVLVFRERLMRNRSDKLKLPKYEIVALGIRAWNLRREGRMTKQLKGLISVGSGKFSFPTII